MDAKTPVEEGDAKSAAEAADLQPIGEVCRSHAITLRSLRFYEQRKLLSSTRRGGARYYDRRQIDRLERILKGKQLGFTLAEIGELLDAAPQKNGGAGFPLADNELASKQLRYLQKRREEIDAAIAALKESIAKSAVSTKPERKSRRSRV